MDQIVDKEIQSSHSRYTRSSMRDNMNMNEIAYSLGYHKTV